jgi:hypothetical protein
MKKILSVLLAVTMVFSLMVGFRAPTAKANSVTVSLSNPTAGANSAYTVSFDVYNALTANVGKITIAFPVDPDDPTASTTVPSSIAANSIQVNGYDCAVVSVKDNKVTVTTPVSIAQGAQVTVYFKTSAGIVNPQKAADTYTLNITDSNNNSYTGTYSIVAGPPVKLAFDSPDYYFYPNGTQTSVTFTITLKDQYGNVAKAGTNGVSVTFSSDTTGYSFNPPAIQISAGNSTSASVTYTHNHLGDATLTATASGLTSATAVAHGVKYQLAFTGGPSSANAGDISGKFTVTLEDENRNPVQVPTDLTVNLSTKSSTGKFYSDNAGTNQVNSVVIPAGSSTASFYYSDTTAKSSWTLKASATFCKPATTSFVVNPAAPYQIVFDTDPFTVQVNKVSPKIVVEVQDRYGNTVPSYDLTTLNLSSDSTTGTFSVDGSTWGATHPASDGSFYYMDTKAGTPTITVTGGGLVKATQQETITSGTPSGLNFVGSSQVVVKGQISEGITVGVYDANGNPTTVAADTDVVLTIADGSTGTFYSDAQGTNPVTKVTIPKGSGTATFYYKCDAPVNESSKIRAYTAAYGDAYLTLTVPNDMPVLKVKTQYYDSATKSYFAQVSGNTTVSVELYEADGTTPLNVKAPVDVTLTSSSSTGKFGTKTTVNLTIAQGSNTTSATFKDTVIETVTLSATMKNGIKGSRDVKVVYGQISVTPATNNITAGNSVTLTVTLQDLAGNNFVATSDMPVSVSSDSKTGVFSPANPVVLTGRSSVSVSYTDTTVSPSDPGYWTVKASIDGWKVGVAKVTVNAASANQIVFTSKPFTARINEASPKITVGLLDKYGNPVTVTQDVYLDLSCDSSTAVFSTDGTNWTASQVCIPANKSSASFYFKDSVVGTPTITVSGTGYQSATQKETIVAFAIKTASLPDATVNKAYTAKFEADGVLAGESVTWSVVSGSLPTGLVLNPVTGDVLGMPTAAGTYTFIVQAQISGKNVLSVKAFTLNVVAPPAPQVTTIIFKIGSPYMTVNGSTVELITSPELKTVGTETRAFVPLRPFAEALGANVQWIPDTQGIMITLGNHQIGLQIGNSSAVADGNVYSVIPPYIKKAYLPDGSVTGVTMVPTRIISECFGAQVDWNQDTKTITITLTQQP